MEKIRDRLSAICSELFSVDVTPELTRPEEQFGDFASNVAMQLAKEQGKNPREIAEQIVSKLGSDETVDKAEVAGPGFINITVTDKYLASQLGDSETHKSMNGQTIIVEYSDPNPFKELHVGHLYDSVLGEAIAKLCENAGAKVIRANFGGDVGMHVAKTMWSIIKSFGGEHPDKLDQFKDADERAKWLSERYVEGNNSYDDEAAAKEQITEINRRIYELHEKPDKDSPFAKIYWTCRQWSYDYFNAFYERIGTTFDKYYPESETAPVGMKVVKEHMSKGVFEESDGAIVFKGEVHSLHTRVFVNSRGLPTYETKDIGLAISKWNDYHFDKNIILTGSDIVEYMKVVLAALGSIEPEIAKRTNHLTHGMVKLSGGKKMSSRKGNVIRAVEVIDMVEEAAKQAKLDADQNTILAAVKYDFLKQRYVSDIIFEPEEAVSLHGNSGPYLQYSHARAMSILVKAPDYKHQTTDKYDKHERSLARKVSEYPEVIEKATTELNPHHICTYLYELTQTFNRFYENSKVIGDERQDIRLGLVSVFAQTLKHGLELLNISAPDKM